MENGRLGMADLLAPRNVDGKTLSPLIAMKSSTSSCAGAVIVDGICCIATISNTRITA
jgi:hypothetical protein